MSSYNKDTVKNRSIEDEDCFIDDISNSSTAEYTEEDTEDEADKIFDANERKKKIFNIIRKIVLVAAAAVFIFAAYNLITIFLEYKEGTDIYNAIEHDVLDDDTTTTVVINDSDHAVEIPFKYDHEALLSINPQGVGYLYIPSIGLRLPMVHPDDNDFYLTHTFNKSYNGNGCLFIDCNIDEGLSASQVIIYGHNMRNGSMFGLLPRYNNYSFWNSGGNSTFYIYTGNVLKEYKIFSAYVSAPISDTYTYNFPTLEYMRTYAASMKEKSLYDTGVDVSNATQIITLSTCTADGENRFIVHGVYVGEGTIE